MIYLIVLIVLGVLSHIYLDLVTAWLCYTFAIISLVLYFMMGTMRVVQEAVSDGDVDLAMTYMNKIFVI